MGLCGHLSSKAVDLLGSRDLKDVEKDILLPDVLHFCFPCTVTENYQLEFDLILLALEDTLHIHNLLLYVMDPCLNDIKG